jgi:hypothetical protein
MPAYITNGQPTQYVALYPGIQYAVVNNAAIDTGITKSVQLAVGPTPGNGTVNLVITNQTNQQAQGQYAPNDGNGVNPTYENLSGCIIPAGSVLPYNLQGGWILLTFATAPTTGSAYIGR